MERLTHRESEKNQSSPSQTSPNQKNDIIKRTQLSLPLLSDIMDSSSEEQQNKKTADNREIASNKEEDINPLSASLISGTVAASFLPNDSSLHADPIPEPDAQSNIAHAENMPTSLSFVPHQQPPLILTHDTHNHQGETIPSPLVLPGKEEPIPPDHFTQPVLPPYSWQKPQRFSYLQWKRTLLFLAIFLIGIFILSMSIYAFAATHTNNAAGTATTSTQQGNNTLLIPKQHLPSQTATQKSTPTAGNIVVPVGTQPLLIVQGHGATLHVLSEKTDTITIQANSGEINRTLVTTTGTATKPHITFTTPSTYGNYTIMVPETTQVSITIPEGSITVNGVSSVALSVDNGNSMITNIRGPLNVSASSGDITVQNIQGNMHLKTINGSIKATTTSGQITAQTQNGDLTLQNATLTGQSSLQTTYGSLYFTGSLNPKGSAVIKIQNGNANLTLPKNAAFQLHTTIASGNVSNAFGETTVGNSPRTELTITITNGSVTLRKSS